jgi:PBP1b-binding outer membrane lipoprotein LpoB
MKATKKKKLCYLILLCPIMFLGGCTAGFQKIAPAPDSHALSICRQEATYLFSNQENFKRPSMLGVCIRY